MRRSLNLCLSVSAAIVFSILAATPQTALAQQEEIDVQAAVGEPLGVGKMIVRFAPGKQPVLVRGQNLWLRDGEGRILYPTYGETATRAPAAGDKQRPDSVTAYFLFRGDRQLHLELEVGSGRYHSGGIAVNNPTAYKALLKEWWQSYSSMVQAAVTADNYPPAIENYLLAMLA